MSDRETKNTEQRIKSVRKEIIVRNLLYLFIYISYDILFVGCGE